MIAKRVAEECSLTPAKAYEAVETMFNAIAEAIPEREVRIRRFGNFRHIFCKARQRRNPRTGELFMMPDHIRIRFVPGPELSQAIRDAETL